MYNFSPNMLKTFDNCTKKFYFQYIKKISVPQKTSYFEKGKKIHALANYYLRGDDITQLEKALTENETITWTRLKNNEYFKKKYINSEYYISSKIADYWIGGRLDALVQDEINYYILDYKTGAIPDNPEYDFQTIVYLLCLSKKFKRDSNINFIYIDLKNNKNHIITLTPEKLLTYEQTITTICSKINNFKQPDNIEHSKKCDFCEYKKICDLY